MKKREKVYRLIKIGGLVTFIPIVMASGPFGGYLVGRYLTDRYGWHYLFVLLFVLMGFVLSIREIVKIVRMIVDTDHEISSL